MWRLGAAANVDDGWALAPLQGAAVRSLWPMACPTTTTTTTFNLFFGFKNQFSNSYKFYNYRSMTTLSTISATNTLATSGILSFHFMRCASRTPEAHKVRPPNAPFSKVRAPNAGAPNFVLEFGPPLLSV